MAKFKKNRETHSHAPIHPHIEEVRVAKTRFTLYLFSPQIFAVAKI